MGGARALIASLGASISLVAGAAVSLLFLSVVFALPGITGGRDGAGPSAAVQIASEVSAAQPARSEAARDASTSVLIREPRPARAAARRESQATVARRKAAVDRPSLDPGPRDPGAPSLPPEATPTPEKPAIGDGVKAVGDAVTATVQGTGAAAAPLLGPPVSKAIQDVLDLLAAVLRGTTGALDKTLPR